MAADDLVTQGARASENMVFAVLQGWDEPMRYKSWYQSTCTWEQGCRKPRTCPQAEIYDPH